MIFKASSAVVFCSLIGLSALAGGCAAAPSSDVDSDISASDALVADSGQVVSVRLVQSSNGAHRLQLRGAQSRVVGEYYPGFFTATLLVPDFADNTTALVPTRSPGSNILAAAINPRTGAVAVAVRTSLVAETSSDTVYIFKTRDKAFIKDPQAPKEALTFLPFDGRSADGTLASASDPKGTRPFLDIRRDGLAYSSEGNLIVTSGDASGGTGTFTYSPTLKATNCSWKDGESRRCPGIFP